MYRILFLNQAQQPYIWGRAYDAFMSAYCLARLGNKVIYVSDKRQPFITGFYEGPLYDIEELFDEKPKATATLQPSLYPHVINILHNSSGIRDAVDVLGGSVDAVWYSGNAQYAAMAHSIANSYKAAAVSADVKLTPCVNEIQLSHLKRRPPEKKNRYCVLQPYVSDDDCDKFIEVAKEAGTQPTLYIIGTYTGKSVEALLDKYEHIEFRVITSDRERLRAIMSSQVFLTAGMNTGPTVERGIVEAFACAVPVIALNSMFPIDDIQVGGRECVLQYEPGELETTLQETETLKDEYRTVTNIFSSLAYRMISIHSKSTRGQGE